MAANRDSSGGPVRRRHRLVAPTTQAEARAPSRAIGEIVDVILKQNKAAFDKLQKGHEQEVHPLEYYPQELKRFFDLLPDSDPRKVFWRTEIDEIHPRNQKAASLIEINMGSTILNPTFVQASVTLLDHINGWRSKWNYALSGIPIPAALENELLAEVFPQAFETELASQIQQIRAVTRS